MFRRVVAFFLAPPLGAGAYALLFALELRISKFTPGDLEIGFSFSDAAMIIVYGFFGAFFGSVIAYPGMILFGLPLMFILRWADVETAYSYALGGAIAGFVMSRTLLRNDQMSVFGEPGELHHALAGGCVMWIFWMIARTKPRQFSYQSWPPGGRLQID